MNLRSDTPTTGIHPDAEQFACEAARLLADFELDAPVTLDLRGLSQVTDLIVIGTGTSSRQLRSVAGDLKDLGAVRGHQLYRTEGLRGGEGAWLVLDFVDVVVHLFLAEQRLYYDLESLWGDADRLDWRARTTPGESARLLGRQASRSREG
jgi:ribosome-associated protein